MTSNHVTAPRVLFLTSETLGSGDDALGRLLLSKWLDTLAQFPDALTHAIFLNGAAKLPIAGSPVLEQLRQLEALGVELLVCGTCLDHFGVRDQLAVGSVSNMVAILETLTRAERILQT